MQHVFSLLLLLSFRTKIVQQGKMFAFTCCCCCCSPIREGRRRRRGGGQCALNLNATAAAAAAATGVVVVVCRLGKRRRRIEFVGVSFHFGEDEDFWRNIRRMRL